MEVVDELQRCFGGRWIGVKFYFEGLPVLGPMPVREVRFCEAVRSSFIGPVLLTPEGLNCRGARYVFGWDEGIRKEMVERFQHEEGFSAMEAGRLVEALPKIGGSLEGIALNVKHAPDVVVSYLQPGQVMKLLRSYQIHFGQELTVALSSIVSVCGHVAVKAYVEQRIALSFGCSDARHYGGITRDRVAVGVPPALGETLLREAR